MTKELECTTESGKLFHKGNCMGEKRIHIIILIGTSSWTNKREIMYVSSLVPRLHGRRPGYEASMCLD